MKKQLLFAVLVATILNAQNLPSTIQEVLSTNPIILEKLKNYNSTKEDITSAKAGYYPKLDLSLGVGYERTDKDNRPAAPDESFDFNVYQNSLTYTQNIFNGFETTYRVEQQKNRTIAASYSYVEKVNDVSFEMVNTYIQVMKNEELLQTAKENIDINEEIFIKVQKLYDSGLTTLSEVNKIESSLSLAKSNYIVQENTLLDVIYNMQRVLGRYLDPAQMSKPIFNTTFPSSLEEATQYAMQNNPSLLISKYNIKLAQATYKEKKSPYYPKFDIEISQSMNKNLSASQGEEDRFRAMAYLKYNIFNGFSDSAALQKSISTIHQEIQTKNNLRRQVIEGMNLSWVANEKLTAQLKHLKDYKGFALKTLKLYSKEYDLGRRSLLDLLSAQNDFIGSKSQIINTEYSLLFAKYRILDSMGTLVKNIMGETDIIYSNVGLDNTTPKNNDSLPVQLDSDNDLIVDDKDICSNSLSTDIKGIYGCKSTLKNISQIERYNGFLFSNTELTDKGKSRFNNLIKQIKPYGFENMKFDIFGNVYSQEMDKKSILQLSAQRAKIIKDMLMKAGAKESSITIYTQADEAPIYTIENAQGQELNNRADIAVKKLVK
ncbi:MAG: TolC family outer membrane protein [Sulfurimonas sp.]|nr:TolC family outer membrane protein [Sulfurimonas sp.]